MPNSIQKDELTTNAVQLIDQMNKAQRSLLLFLETQAVDHGGLVTSISMNAEDHEIAREWAAEGFLRFSRMKSALIPDSRLPKYAHVVELTPFAFECAAIERRRRAERSQRKDIVQESLSHFESLRR